MTAAGESAWTPGPTNTTAPSRPYPRHPAQGRRPGHLGTPIAGGPRPVRSRSRRGCDSPDRSQRRPASDSPGRPGEDTRTKDAHARDHPGESHRIHPPGRQPRQRRCDVPRLGPGGTGGPPEAEHARLRLRRRGGDPPRGRPEHGHLGGIRPGRSGRRHVSLLRGRARRVASSSATPTPGSWGSTPPGPTAIASSATRTPTPGTTRDSGRPPSTTWSSTSSTSGPITPTDAAGNDLRTDPGGTFLDVARPPRIPGSTSAINAVEPLPIVEFESQTSLGYNGSDLFSPEIALRRAGRPASAATSTASIPCSPPRGTPR